VKEVIKEEPGEEDEEEKNNKLLEQLKTAIKASINKPNKYITNPVRLYLIFILLFRSLNKIISNLFSVLFLNIQTLN
jgi:hypothetical protein